jgi:hypothetical protein
MAAMGKDGNRSQSPSVPSVAAGGFPQLSTRRRALPSPTEQTRREEWGKKWGKLVSEAVREAIGGTDK